MQPDLSTSSYDYELPPDRIAQRPVPRGEARLLVLRRERDQLEDRSVAELPALLAAGDLLVTNDVRVRPARLVGRRQTGGKAELQLMERRGPGRWHALIRAARRLRPGEPITVDDALVFTVLEDGAHGYELSGPDGWAEVAPHGRAPLPPYIKRPADEPLADRQRDLADYQTVFARDGDAVAAPTAGLHITEALLDELTANGIERTSVTLEVGAGTFMPVKTEQLARHPMHAERYRVTAEAAAALERARAEGRRVVALGTTSCRVLETLARHHDRPWRAAAGETRIFIHPPQALQLTDALMTNFHLPKSTLLMLVSAMTGRERILEAYRHAVDAGYRFHSYGDSMLIL